MRTRAVSRALLATGVAIGVLPIVGADPAYACSCVRSDEQHHYEQATHVFKGTVVAAQGAAAVDGQSGAEPVVYTFDVISAYKGRVHDPQKVSTPGSSAACGVELDGAGPFLVFASRDLEAGAQSAGDELTMDLCGGTRPIGENDEPTFGKDAGAPAEPGAAEAPPAAPPAAPPGAPPAPPPEREPGLTSRLIEDIGGLIGELGGLVGQVPPPGG